MTDYVKINDQGAIQETLTPQQIRERHLKTASLPLRALPEEINVETPASSEARRQLRKTLLQDPEADLLQIDAQVDTMQPQQFDRYRKVQDNPPDIPDTQVATRNPQPRLVDGVYKYTYQVRVKTQAEKDAEAAAALRQQRLQRAATTRNDIQFVAEIASKVKSLAEAAGDTVDPKIDEFIDDATNLREAENTRAR